MKGEVLILSLFHACKKALVDGMQETQIRHNEVACRIRLIIIIFWTRHTPIAWLFRFVFLIKMVQILCEDT